ncbi:hypothetical protein [Terriglobus tenax]|uniref:hypothetical protein n=1 Tax=Terriglobus tenax TaxID=1111115 RepID=UPI0021E0843E|nr:hypothetical protein [Terriglobus tenax]
MDDLERDVTAGTAETAPKKRHSKKFVVFKWLGITALAVFLVLGGATWWLARNAEPIMRQRIIDTLSARFKSPVELDEFHVTIAKGLGVEGKGLRIMYLMQVNDQGQQRSEPMLAIDEFRFRTTLNDLRKSPTHVGEVHVTGLHIRKPPREDRKITPPEPKKKPKESIVVDRIVVDHAALVMETNKPDKLPLEWDIAHLVLVDVGADRPFDYTATLVNPKPLGDIASKGHFGPWNVFDPGATPLDGTYSFDNADLRTTKGIGGILSSKGSFGGSLDNITADGETDTPDFRLDVSEHPVPLHTKFHAIIDGTNGDVLLQPVEAWLARSYFVCVGHVINNKDPKGKDIRLEVVMPKARIEDMLRLGVKTSPPLMTGAFTMKTKLHIPPGDVDISKKIELADGSFEIRGAHFTSDKIQEKIDALSMRAQGKPKQANAEATADFDVSSDMRGRFQLKNGIIHIPSLRYDMAGAQVLMLGEYSTDGNKFDFVGKVRTKAHLSQMVSGWKGWLLKPADPFFSKHGAGAEIPIKINGTKDEPHFGPDFKDDRTKDLGKGMEAPK